MVAAAQTHRAEIRCVVADDHPPIIDSLSRFLVAAGFAVVGSALDGEAALAAVEELEPDVLVTDVRMPRVDGLELAARVAKASPRTKVLLYSGLGDTGLVSDALDAGARGFAVKDAPLDDLARAIDVVASGGLYIDPVLGARLASPRRTVERRALSEREREVLRMLAEGDTYNEIGKRVFLSPDTVRSHAHRAMTKLDARTRTHAVAVAVRDGLIG
ncbi:MAG TPA: response regulator transcription factor [Gaiellaceae bacterium]|nr:response regulator transcription factor [Gaiellaceae bacterium]